ncbi:platelet glycoprotein Ib alpha chain-like [Onychostoma macrolepis]|uniref:platelet glycoprotein Ib alpha chain-like n=1 Tax=Onychostoma macrolepis TaxID=369639 RepID=UPI00272C938C|nr:platelet glycoprotein Ib alpha chain-like [Onychostoma macrolepis]
MEDKVIIAVCGLPELYDTSSYHYRNRNKKDLAWRKVSEEVGQSEPTGPFDGSEPGSLLPEPAAASASPAGPSTSAATVPTAPPRRRAQKRPRSSHRRWAAAPGSTRTRPEAPAPPPRSEDELFLLSLVPSLQKLPPQTKDFVKFQIHKLIYESSTVLLNLEQLEPQ